MEAEAAAAAAAMEAEATMTIGNPKSAKTLSLKFQAHPVICIMNFLLQTSKHFPDH
eukprot:CAMPEP_0183735244 /NCGR_PEP_ID=MMETSP0737-20130205/46101_1 /TAXON_ID=385413 /ORGANISM="Thalassiosira miniscula, Strain CCMP1093" /LENGTH=55 /DNA_ID=CAMNT_0025968923 /DNA_START=18 /DNA_END=185 /DNA_ORIENTATION=-